MLSSGLIIHAEYLGIEVMNLPGDLKNPPVGRKNKGETQRVAGEFICFWGGRYYTSGSRELHLFISDSGLFLFEGCKWVELRPQEELVLLSVKGATSIAVN